MTRSELFSRIIKMPEKHTFLDYSRFFTRREFEKLKSGITAESMDDKWVGFFYENAFYLCRSWTGICIYDFQLKEISNGYILEKVRANRDPTHYRFPSDDYDVLLLNNLLSAFDLSSSEPAPHVSGIGTAESVEQYPTAGVDCPVVETKNRRWWKLW